MPQANNSPKKRQDTPVLAFFVYILAHICYTRFNWSTRATSEPLYTHMQIDVDNLAKLCEQLPDYGKLIVDSNSVRWVRSFKVQAQQLRSVLALRTADEHLEVDRFPDGFRVTMQRVLSSGSSTTEP